MQTNVHCLKRQCSLVNVEQCALLCNGVGAHWFLRISLLLTHSATIYDVASIVVQVLLPLFMSSAKKIT